MDISRAEAVELIEEKILQLQKILAEANYDNLNSEEYKSIRQETKILVSDLFSEAETKKFEGPLDPLRVVSPRNYEKELEEYKKKIMQSITKLKDYEERIQNFWFNGEIGGDRKVIERALLLIRVYDIRKIYDIGKEINLPYFSSFNDYEEMSYHRGALEISQVMTDEALLKLIKENPPKYGLSLGGFQGGYYTATEKGELTLTSSWENVRRNIQQSLERWNEKVYGVLQAIINKRGIANNTDIHDEIEKILGPGYSWEDLLSRLQQRKLIFKNYSFWEMPPEIIPIVQEELSSHKKKKEIIPNIVQVRRQINLIFNTKFKTKLLRENEQAIEDIKKSCENEDDFNNRIQVLSTLIDEMETKSLEDHIDYEGTGSVNILKEFLDEKFPDYDEKIINNFRNIIKLRSKKYPVHKDDPEFIGALKYFGLTYPPHWRELGEKVLEKYYESLELLLTCLNTS